MPGLFDALQTATRGLTVTQRSLATTGHNIANVNTPGYSRQRSVVVAGTPQPDAAGTIGSGVEQLTVERIVDQFVNTRLVSETTRFAGLDAEASLYREIEAIVNDQLTEGLSDELSGFFDALADLSSSTTPGQPVERGQVLAAGEALVDTVHRWDNQLRTLQRDTDRGIVGLIPEINALATEIAELNGRIAEAETLSPANDLRDRQDRLILDLAERIEITTLTTDDGSVSVRLASGLSLVDRRVAGQLEAVVDPANPNPLDATFSQVYYVGAGSSFDVTDQITGGQLGSLVQGREQVIAGTIADLDAFVYTLVDTFNTQHRLGVGLVDDGANDFFADMSTRPTIDGAARDFSIAAAIDPDQGGTTSNIAAGDRANVGGGLPGEDGDTEWVRDVLAGIRTERVTGYLAGDVPGVPTGNSAGIAANLINLTGEVGQRTRTANRALEQQEALLQSVQDRRDSISTVSIDEEVAELVKLQSNFQANARVVRTVSEMIQDLFDAI
ncbi:MAG: flagellar hook-associated protein FlgK [Myxococcota bacterium]